MDCARFGPAWVDLYRLRLLREIHDKLKYNEYGKNTILYPQLIRMFNIGTIFIVINGGLNGQVIGQRLLIGSVVKDRCTGLKL